MVKNNNKNKERLHQFKVAAGIISKKRVFTGPLTVQIDLTNQCNNNCLGCWCRSPLLKDKAMGIEEQYMFIPFAKVKEIIDELYTMGVNEVYFTGGGEPFMHQNILKIIKYVKDKNMKCDMSTNFTIINKDVIRNLVEWRVDHMNLSIWAGTKRTYKKLHSNKSEKTFIEMEKKLNFFSRVKKESNTNLPIINIYNVISRVNYSEIREMIKFAAKNHADSVEFTMIDVIPKRTESLLLGKDEQKKLISLLDNIPEYLNWVNQKYGSSVIINSLDQFIRRAGSPGATKGFYDVGIAGKVLSSCYAGWTFLRILANGNVIPCLKAIRYPIGNIYQNTIKEIWLGDKQRIFRNKTINYNPKDTFFNKFGNDETNNGCYSSCDNLGLNLAIDKRIKSINKIERAALKSYIELSNVAEVIKGNDKKK